MHPELAAFDLFGRHIVVMAYGAAMCLAVLVVAVFGWLGVVRRKTPRCESAVVAIAVALSFPFGARLLDWALASRAQSAESVDVLFRPEFSGFALPGGMLLSLVTSVGLCFLLRVNWWRFADGMAPAVYVGAAILRMGCFLNGCCFGAETSRPWGVVFPMGSPAHFHQAANCFNALFREPMPVHPTQLYELGAAVAALVVATVLLRQNLPDGAAAMAAMTCYLGMRWGVHHLRAVALPPGIAGDAFYAIAISLTIGCFLIRLRKDLPAKSRVAVAQFT